MQEPTAKEKEETKEEKKEEKKITKKTTEEQDDIPLFYSDIMPLLVRESFLLVLIIVMKRDDGFKNQFEFKASAGLVL